MSTWIWHTLDCSATTAGFRPLVIWKHLKSGLFEDQISNCVVFKGLGYSDCPNHLKSVHFWPDSDGWQNSSHFSGFQTPFQMWTMCKPTSFGLLVIPTLSWNLIGFKPDLVFVSLPSFIYKHYFYFYKKKVQASNSSLFKWWPEYQTIWIPNYLKFGIQMFPLFERSLFGSPL